MDHPDRESSWDWVTARRACSLEAFFERLYLGAVKNVEVRKAQCVEAREPIHLDVERVDPSQSSVIRVIERGRVATVRFRRSRTTILVDGHEVPITFTGTVTMNDEGQCRLLVGGHALDEWQVLRRACESLFFDDLAQAKG